MKIKGMVILVTGLAIILLTFLRSPLDDSDRLINTIALSSGIILVALGSILFELEILNELLAEKLSKLLKKEEEAEEEKEITREACEALGGTIKDGRCIVGTVTEDGESKPFVDLGKIIEEE